MEQISTVGARIGALLKQKGLTAYQLAKNLGHTSPQKLYKNISDDAKPGYETLVELLEHFPDLSPAWLLLGRGPMIATDAAPASVAASGLLAPAHRGVTSGRVVTVTVDRMGGENILHIPARAQAGYAHSYDEPAYLRDMVPYSLPMFAGGSFRSFEVDGDSMAPTFGHRDTVVCQFVDRWDLLAPGHCYVVVLTDNVYVKRLPAAVRDRRSDVELVSDNRAYPVHRVPASDLVEIWQVRACITTNIPASSREVTERMVELLEALGVEQQQTRRILESLAPGYAPTTEIGR